MNSNMNYTYFLLIVSILFVVPYSCKPLCHIIDLGHNLDESSIAWDLRSSFNYTKKIAHYSVPPNNTWYSANEFKTPEHIGTHLDAPYHFSDKGWMVAEIPLERFVVQVFGLYFGYRSYSFTRPVDLSFGIDGSTMNWDSSSKYTLTKSEIYLPDSTYKSYNKVCFPEHSGTHLDAPSYMIKSARKVADIPIESLIVQGIHIDVSNEVHGEPKFVLEEHHLRRWTETYGKIESKSVVLINFGWASRYWNRSSYMGYTENSRNFPGISIPAARWIVENSNIVGVGVDTPSVDVGHSDTYDVHKILTSANLYMLENVALNNTYLPARGFQLVVMPMKLTHGTGAPVRIIASPYCIGAAGLAKVSKFALLSMFVVSLMKTFTR